MSLLPAAVRIGVTGEVNVAQVGSTAPTDATTALDAAFTGLGLVSEDGVTESWDDSVDNIKAWQNNMIVRAQTTDSVATFQFVMIETKGKTIEAYYKGSTITATGLGKWKIDVKGAQSDPRAWVIDVVDATKHYRIYVPTGEITERGEIVYSNGEPIGYDVTLTCYADANGVLFTKFADDANWGYS